jgi:hypothetical protein
MKIEKFYRMRAREIVDMLHDKGFFEKGVTREAMRKLQDYIAYILKTTADGSVKMDRLNRNLESK